MIDLPKPGAYVVRAPHAEDFSKSLVQHWLNSQEETPFKSCLWVTTSAQDDVFKFLEPYLSHRTKTPRGLDVVSARDLWKKGQTRNSVRQLCRSLNTMCFLKPALVIIENALLWFDDQSETLNKRNPMAQMQLLHRWALHAQASVLTIEQGDLPPWSVFADGLADLNAQGHFDFRPWWPTQWGMQTSLWNNPEDMGQLLIHHVLDSERFENIKQLAQTCYHLRFSSNAMQGIHIQTHNELSSLDASVLLRMGADSVLQKNEDPATWLGLPKNKIHAPNLTSQATSHDTVLFARDLHEVFMPGQLTLISNHAFATCGLMMLELTQQWSMHCSITRFSLLPHMAAQTALRLANWSKATCVFTATREAVYVLKIWNFEPDESSYAEWIDSCFNEQLNNLFSGDIQFIGTEKKTELLADLDEEPNPLSIENLMPSDTFEEVRLTELWDENRNIDETNRPWLRRISQLLKGEQA